MHKRVLLVSQSDTLRTVAEMALRQNGYDVISVSSCERALEVIGLSRPELVIAGAELTYRNQRPFYERLKADPTTASLPLLLIAQPDQKDLGMPDEVVLRVPFDPQEFLERVKVFTGAVAPPSVAATNPLDGASVGDDFLDAALGLDSIEVTASEVMDKTLAGNGKRPAAQKAMADAINVEKTDPHLTDSGRVESIMIRDDQSDIVQKPAKQPNSVDLSASQKLDILSESDQYGMAISQATTLEPVDSVHDYNWFVNEMQRDNTRPSSVTSPTPTRPAAGDSGRLKVDRPATLVEPVHPSGAVASSKPADGVGKFIDEFKKEIEKFRDHEPESIVVEAEKHPSLKGPVTTGSDWQETVEKLTPDDVIRFTHEFAKELGRRVADLIVDKIDPEKLLRLMAAEISRQKSKEK